MSNNEIIVPRARVAFLFIGGTFTVVGCLDIMLNGKGFLNLLFAVWGIVLFAPAALLGEASFGKVCKSLAWLLKPLDWWPPPG